MSVPISPTYVDSNHVRPRQLSSPSAGSGSTAHEYRIFFDRIAAVRITGPFRSGKHLRTARAMAFQAPSYGSRRRTRLEIPRFMPRRDILHPGVCRGGMSRARRAPPLPWAPFPVETLPRGRRRQVSPGRCHRRPGAAGDAGRPPFRAR